MKRLLLITTIEDWSALLFLTHAVTSKVSVDILFYHESLDVFDTVLTKSSYDFIYFRDPFNSQIDLDAVQEKVELVLKNRQDAYIVDSISSYDDILFEDKWIQYELYKEFMPPTLLLEDITTFENATHIAKKRISSRSKGIAFTKDDIQGEPNEHIVQQMQRILTEYRVYALFNVICEEASVKTPKTPTSKAKVESVTSIPEHIKIFTQRVLTKNKFDFIGLDIAETESGITLFEVNRSPLFNGFFREKRLNMAERIAQGLLDNIYE